MWRTLLDFKIGNEQLSRDMAVKFLEILPTKRNLFPHTIEILNYLTEKKYALHLITNGFEKTFHMANRQINHIVAARRSHDGVEQFHLALHL